MPNHSNNKMMPLKKLTDKQKDRLKKHSVHHSQKHMRVMRMKMLQGQTFSQAHKHATDKVGK